MNNVNNILFSNKRNFLFFKIFVWICAGLIFKYFSVLIPVGSNDFIKVFLVFACLAVVINFHISFLPKILSKQRKFIHSIFLTIPIICCTLLEMILFSKSINFVYSFLDKKIVFLFVFFYINLRNFALFGFFFCLEYFYRLTHLYHEKEKVHQKEIMLLIEKQEFEKKYSRKKLLPHYLFNILEHISIESLANYSDNKLIDKIKFVLYYFLVDAESEKIELEKDLAFYKYYIELENLRHRKNILIQYNIIGQTERFKVIPLLFEPLIGNAMKYTKQDGTGLVNITVDAQNFPVLKFHCINNYLYHASNIISSDNGLKIFEQRLQLCYTNKHVFTITQNEDFFEVALTIEVV